MQQKTSASAPGKQAAMAHSVVFSSIDQELVCRKALKCESVDIYELEQLMITA
jgi:hypothetical protein